MGKTNNDNTDPVRETAEAIRRKALEFNRLVSDARKDYGLQIAAALEHPSSGMPQISISSITRRY